MSALSQFLVKEGPFRGAYRMDDKDGEDMRKHAGLGVCDCCDYFIPQKTGAVVLVEETSLAGTVGMFREEFAAAPAPEKNRKDGGESQYINNRIMWENRLKVYGGMLVLSRYAARCGEVAKILAGGKFLFRLVDIGASDGRDEEDLEFWKQKLFVNFRGVFSREMIADVEVLRLADLAEELPEG